MLAHSEQHIDTGNNLLKISDMPIIMTTETFENDLSYHQRLEPGFQEQPHYYQQYGYEQQPQYHHAGPPAGEMNHIGHPHQQMVPQHNYYQQQQMYCQQNQPMGGYSHQPEQVKITYHFTAKKVKKDVVIYIYF